MILEEYRAGIKWNDFQDDFHSLNDLCKLGYGWWVPLKYIVLASKQNPIITHILKKKK